MRKRASVENENTSMDINWHLLEPPSMKRSQWRCGNRRTHRKCTVQPKSSRYKPLWEKYIIERREKVEKVRTKVIFMRSFFLYRCVKEDATEITLMMLFFYLLDHMHPMSFKL